MKKEIICREFIFGSGESEAKYYLVRDVGLRTVWIEESFFDAALADLAEKEGAARWVKFQFYDFRTRIISIDWLKETSGLQIDPEAMQLLNSMEESMIKNPKTHVRKWREKP
jgi:hypothetical protein